MRPTTVRYPERPLPPPTTGTISTVTTTGTNVLRPARFDTSTTTLDDHDQRQYWSDTYGQSPVVQPRPDGFIRPITPEIGVVRIGLNISTNGQPDPLPSPTTYRSSTTVYTRDKNHRVEYQEDRPRPVKPREDPIVVPPKIRYTPSPIKPVVHLDEDNEVQEERYEVSYQYERQLEEYSYDTRQYHDETHLHQRYTGKQRRRAFSPLINLSL